MMVSKIHEIGQYVSLQGIFRYTFGGQIPGWIDRNTLRYPEGNNTLLLHNMAAPTRVCVMNIHAYMRSGITTPKKTANNTTMP
jgi:hypothetical protein